MAWSSDDSDTVTETPAPIAEPAPPAPPVDERLAALEAEVARLAFRVKQHLG